MDHIIVTEERRKNPGAHKKKKIQQTVAVTKEDFLGFARGYSTSVIWFHVLDWY